MSPGLASLPFIWLVSCPDLSLSHLASGVAPPLKPCKLQGGTYPRASKWNPCLQPQASQPGDCSRRAPCFNLGNQKALTSSTSLPAKHSQVFNFGPPSQNSAHLPTALGRQKHLLPMANQGKSKKFLPGPNGNQQKSTVRTGWERDQEKHGTAGGRAGFSL